LLKEYEKVETIEEPITKIIGPPKIAIIDEIKELKRKPMIPMSQEEYIKKSNQISEVFDPDTGRTRLVKGSGEIIEKIVSRDQQNAIRKMASHWSVKR